MNIEIALGIVYIVVFIGTMISIILMSFHFWHAYQGIRGSRNTLANLMGPFSFFLSSNFDEKGNYHRVRFTWCLLLTLLLFVVVAMLAQYLGFGS
jgi:hypothetical protein